ncbi:MAG: hypothetical protein JW714_01015 [Candidatus Omnitrophica bacterium]|nr:hypothetical protein [Candidatus Omnitrophota bacterium]
MIDKFKPRLKTIWIDLRKRTSGIFQQLAFNSLNRALLVIMLLLVCYLIFDFLLNSAPRIEERVLTLNQGNVPPLEIPEQLSPETNRPLSGFTEILEGRDIFGASGDTAALVPSQTFMEMVANLRLQGIISGASPQAIIEDTKNNQVFFLYPGEHIGEIELKQILPGKIILNYYGQETELAM